MEHLFLPTTAGVVDRGLLSDAVSIQTVAWGDITDKW
jgi:hypothetical protein